MPAKAKAKHPAKAKAPAKPKGKAPPHKAKAAKAVAKPAAKMKAPALGAREVDEEEICAALLAEEGEEEIPARKGPPPVKKRKVAQDFSDSDVEAFGISRSELLAHQRAPSPLDSLSSVDVPAESLARAVLDYNGVKSFHICSAPTCRWSRRYFGVCVPALPLCRTLSGSPPGKMLRTQLPATLCGRSFVG
ncbi:unnamed protein product [Amoebophrya sp. A120]|nr:unnamed protein product [Amoebophrya sp. A120]|eukprot:GSA120T00021868001.1